MLSQELEALRERLEPGRYGGLQVAPEQVDLLIIQLRMMAEDARQLERMKIPEAAKITPADLASGEVVRLDERRHEPTRFHVLTGGGGDAA